MKVKRVIPKVIRRRKGEAMTYVYLYGVFKKTTAQFPIIKTGPGKFQASAKSDHPTPVRLVDIPNVMHSASHAQPGIVRFVMKPAVVTSPNIDRKTYDRRGKVLEER
jgi:hypothetical protein